MVKSTEDVVKDFNEIVNMTAEELDEFLHTEASETTGYKKDDGSGESIGHESGRHIVDILKRNPDKDPSKYTDEDKEHMRRVVSYCKRHLAQESHLKEEKTPEELEKMKSTRSLKNWGHDPLKATPSATGGSNKPKSSGKPTSKNSTKGAVEKNDKEEEAAGKKETTEKPKSSGKPKSSAKPASKKAEKKEEPSDDKREESVEEKKEDKAEKPKSVGKAKPASKKAPAEKEEQEKEAEVGEKREAEKAEKSEKPASKKAKTEKPVTEATRKPPSRSAKKA